MFEALVKTVVLTIPLITFHLDKVQFLMTKHYVFTSTSNSHLAALSRSVLIIWHDCMDSLFFYVQLFYRKR